MKLFVSKNGMKVLLKKAPANSVVISVGVFAGAFYPEAKAGLAHMVEHNLFSSEDVFLNEIGTYIEAFTNDFYTTYQVRSSKERMNECLDLLLEKVFSAKLSEKFFEREKGIIYEEFLKQRGNYMSDNAFKSLNKFYEKTFIGNSGYGIGDKAQLDDISFKDVKGFYKKHYTYSNSVLVVVGNFDEEALYKKLYGEEIKRLALLEEKDIGQDSSCGLNVLSLKLKTSTSAVDITFSAANILSKTLAAYELLAIMIGAGENSLVKNRLRKELGIIYQCDCSVDADIAYKGCGTMSIRYFVAGENVERSIGEIFALLKTSNEKLKRMLPGAKEQLINNLNIKCDNIEFVCESNIKSLLVLGKPFELNEEIKKIKKVGEEEIFACLEHILNNRKVVSVMGKKIGSLKGLV